MRSGISLRVNSLIHGMASASQVHPVPKSLMNLNCVSSLRIALKRSKLLTPLSCYFVTVVSAIKSTYMNSKADVSKTPEARRRLGVPPS